MESAREDALRARARELVACARELGARGFVPATSGNLSLRLDERHAAVTVSGRDKSRLVEADVIAVDIETSSPAGDEQPSAETLLHLQLYRRSPQVAAVLHTHSVTQTVASRLFAREGAVRLHGYELLKAIAGTTSHDTTVEIPVLPNQQHIPSLCAEVARRIADRPLWGYLIEAHGLYAWGRDLAEARRHLEAFEALLACELAMTRR